MPVGGGFGKVFRIGKLPFNVNFGYYANVVRPDPGADWTLRLQIALLLPKSIFNNWFALERTNIVAPSALALGKHTIVYEFIPDEAKPGTGGRSILTIDGERVAEGHIPKTQPFAFSADEGADVGEDGETNVLPDYKHHDNTFTGTIHKVTIDLKEIKAANAEAEQQAVREAHARKALAV